MNAYDHDDPRNNEAPEYNDHRIGCRCNECDYEMTGGAAAAIRDQIGVTIHVADPVGRDGFLAALHAEISDLTDGHTDAFDARDWR